MLVVLPSRLGVVDVTLQRGRPVRGKGGYCLPPHPGRVSIAHKGFVTCILTVPRKARRLVVHLKPDDDSYKPEGYCLSK